MKLDEDQARFVVKSFRKKESYVDQYMEGELRELVELRVPAAVLDKLIFEKKVKGKGGVIFFPKIIVGAKDTYGKDEAGLKPPTSLTDREAHELEQGMGNMRELLASDPIQALSELAIELGAASSSNTTVAPGPLALQEAIGSSVVIGSYLVICFWVC